MIALALLAPSSAAARGFEVGFFDPTFSSPDAGERGLWLDRARASGAQVVRVTLPWNGVTSARPADPENPADPAYRWTAVDAAVRDASARGLRVILTIGGAPTWAQQGTPPPTAGAGTWKPDPVALGQFARAAATRYSGATPDPGLPGALLPAVRAWQIWNEPNLSVYLNPQWENGRPFAAAHYRAMLAAAYDAIKAVSPANLVAAGGTAPYGDDAGGRRIRPLRFWRELLCLRGRDLRPFRCSPAPRFDVAAHHPYGVAGPTTHALNPDDAAVPDVGRISRLVRTAVARGTVLPKRAKPMWVTEISWDSRPPDPDAVSAERQAAWLSQALAVLWRQRVALVTWFRIRDQAPVPSFAATNQSGLYLLTGEPKPSLQAFGFPFACDRAGTTTRIWGRAPVPGEVILERRRGGAWRRVRAIQVGAERVFGARLTGRATFRAREDAAASLPCAR